MSQNQGPTSGQDNPLWPRAAAAAAATLLLAGLAVAFGWETAFDTGAGGSPAMTAILALLCVSGISAAALLLSLRRLPPRPAEREVGAASPPTQPTGRSSDDNERLERGVVQLLEIVSSAAEGDLTARGEITHDELGSVTDALNHMLESIGRLVLEVRRSGMSVTTAAERILSLSESMAAGAAKQSIVLNLVTKKIQALGERSLEINQIVELIDDISAQTNMLALNAAIEAAKAGEQGKGFAVVANEVRKLAERTSSATKDIGSFIQSIQAATVEAVRAMEEIRSETRSTADGAVDTTRAADEMVEASRTLGITIGRFKVHRRNADELAQTLDARRQEMRSSLRALLDMANVAASAGPSSRIAADMLLEDLQELTDYAQQRIARPAGEVPPDEAPTSHGPVGSPEGDDAAKSE